MLCRKCRFLLFYTHSVAGAPLCVCVCVCCHQLSLFQTSLSFCFIYISTRVCQGLPRLPSNFLCNDSKTDNQTAAVATTTRPTRTLSTVRECVIVTFRGSYFALIFNDVDFYNWIEAAAKADTNNRKGSRRERKKESERASNYRVDNLYAQTTWKLAQFYGESLSALWHICHTWRMRNIL